MPSSACQRPQDQGIGEDLFEQRHQLWPAAAVVFQHDHRHDVIQRHHDGHHHTGGCRSILAKQALHQRQRKQQNIAAVQRLYHHSLLRGGFYEPRHRQHTQPNAHQHACRHQCKELQPDAVAAGTINIAEGHDWIKAVKNNRIELP